MEELVKLGRLPDKEEVKLQSICESVEQVIKHCVEGVQDCQERSWNLIPFWLASPEKGKAGLTPFRSYFKDNTTSDMAATGSI